MRPPTPQRAGRQRPSARRAAQQLRAVPAAFNRSIVALPHPSPAEHPVAALQRGSPTSHMPSVAIAWAPAASVLPAPRRSTGKAGGWLGGRGALCTGTTTLAAVAPWPSRRRAAAARTLHPTPTGLQPSCRPAPWYPWKPPPHHWVRAGADCGGARGRRRGAAAHARRACAPPTRRGGGGCENSARGLHCAPPAAAFWREPAPRGRRAVPGRLERRRRAGDDLARGGWVPGQGWAPGQG